MGSQLNSNNNLNYELVDELIEVHQAYKELEKKLGTLKDSVKDGMKKANLDTLTRKGGTVTLSKSERKTPAKDIINKLVSMNLHSCLKTEIKADVDRLKMEIGLGNLSQSDYDKLVKVSSVYTMNIK